MTSERGNLISQTPTERCVTDVELSSSARICVVKGYKLYPHQIVSGRDTGGHGEIRPTPVGDHVVDPPCSTCQTIRCNFKPLKSSGSGSCSVGHLGEVDKNGTLADA